MVIVHRGNEKYVDVYFNSFRKTIILESHGINYFSFCFGSVAVKLATTATIVKA